MTKQNVDASEVNKFSQNAAHWWDTHSEYKPLHEINPLRLEFIRERVDLNGMKVLDIGCGGGILSESLAQCGAKVTGIDMSEAALNTAKLHQLESGTQVEYLHITAEELAESHAGQFDIITCLEMLEHVPDPISVIAAAAKLCKPKGHIFFSTLNRNMKAYLFAIVGAEYILKIVPEQTHDFNKFIQPAELSQWARQADLTLKSMGGITYNPLTKKYKRTDDVSVNYLCHFEK